MRNVISAALVSILLSASTLACAKTFDFSEVSLSDEYNTTSFRGGALLDSYKFSISDPSYFRASVFNTMQNSAVLSDLKLSLTPEVLTPFAVGTQTQNYFGILEAGDYWLNVSAMTSSAGSYSIHLIASPIPEPQSYAMLFWGLLLVGAMARKPKQKHDS